MLWKYFLIFKLLDIKLLCWIRLTVSITKKGAEFLKKCKLHESFKGSIFFIYEELIGYVINLFKLSLLKEVRRDRSYISSVTLGYHFIFSVKKIFVYFTKIAVLDLENRSFSEACICLTKTNCKYRKETKIDNNKIIT